MLTAWVRSTPPIRFQPASPKSLPPINRPAAQRDLNAILFESQHFADSSRILLQRHWYIGRKCTSRSVKISGQGCANACWDMTGQRDRFVYYGEIHRANFGSPDYSTTIKNGRFEKDLEYLMVWGKVTEPATRILVVLGSRLEGLHILEQLSREMLWARLGQADLGRSTPQKDHPKHW